MLPSHVIGPNFLDSRARLSFLNMLMAIFDSSCSDSSVWEAREALDDLDSEGLKFLQETWQWACGSTDESLPFRYRADCLFTT